MNLSFHTLSGRFKVVTFVAVGVCIAVGVITFSIVGDIMEDSSGISALTGEALDSVSFDSVTSVDGVNAIAVFVDELLFQLNLLRIKQVQISYFWQI